MTCVVLAFAAFVAYCLAIAFTFSALSDPKPRAGRVGVGLIVMIATGLAVGSLVSGGGV